MHKYKWTGGLETESSGTNIKKLGLRLEYVFQNLRIYESKNLWKFFYKEEVDNGTNFYRITFTNSQ